MTAAVAARLGQVGLHAMVTHGMPAAITAEVLLHEVRAGKTLRPAGPLFPLPCGENGDVRSPLVT